MKIGVVGANGQVGAELCLLLRQLDDIELIPICRTRMGSAFLRYHGVRCRHGNVADPNEVERLIADCDVLFNLALPSLATDLRRARTTHGAIIAHLARFSQCHTVLIYASSMSVYGDARVDQLWPIRNSYGTEKAWGERCFLRSARKRHRHYYVFRLGHVCGDLQAITTGIRELCRHSPLPIPRPDSLSNTLQVATIANAVRVVASRESVPGTYDLMNVPQWTWREVIEYEAHRAGVDVQVEQGAVLTGGALSRTMNHARAALHSVLVAETAHRVGGRLLRWLSRHDARRVKALFSIKAAARDISQLDVPPDVMDALMRVPIQGVFLRGLTPTAVLLAEERYRAPLAPPPDRWPADLCLVRCDK